MSARSLLAVLAAVLCTGCYVQEFDATTGRLYRLNRLSGEICVLQVVEPSDDEKIRREAERIEDPAIPELGPALVTLACSEAAP